MEDGGGASVTVRLQGEDGSVLNDAGIVIPSTSTQEQLQLLANKLLNVSFYLLLVYQNVPIALLFD